MLHFAWCMLQVLAGWWVADALTAGFHLFIDRLHPRYWHLPWLGPMALEFQRHHRDPLYFLRFTWWYNSKETLFAAACLLPVAWAWPWFGVPLVVGVAINQVVHRMAHESAADPAGAPLLVVLLQHLGIFLPPEVHDLHHGDYTGYYGTLNGWSNRPINAVLRMLRMH